MQIQKLGAIAATVAAVAFTSSAVAAPITGTPVGGSNFSPASTNALNYDNALNNIPRPYVLFDFADIDSITLNFFNNAPGVARFEIRIDDLPAGTTAHPVAIGDTIHPGPNLATNSVFSNTYTATSFIDVRLALGGESDYRFDWTRFDVAATNNAVPEPGSLALAGLALLGVAAVRRRRS